MLKPISQRKTSNASMNRGTCKHCQQRIDRGKDGKWYNNALDEFCEIRTLGMVLPQEHQPV